MDRPEGRDSRRLAVAGWALVVAALAALAWTTTHELRYERAVILRKERLIRSVMFHHGWSPSQIEGIAAGRIDPYSPEAAPASDPEERP